MAKSINQVLIMGNLTKDPDLKSVPSGASVASFSLALNRSYQDANNEWQESTDFVDVVAWGKLAEQVSERLVKGNRALVTGRIQSRSYEKDGLKRVKMEILAQDVTFLDKPVEA